MSTVAKNVLCEHACLERIPAFIYLLFEGFGGSRNKG